MRTLKLLPLALLLLAGQGRAGAEPVPQFDIAVTAVDIAAAPAGEPSAARITITNRGTQTLYPSDYEIEVKALADGKSPPPPSRCSIPAPPLDSTDYPDEIAPGQSEVVTVHHVFPRAGTFAVTVQARLDYEEDGSAHDDAMTVARTVPPARCKRWSR